MKITFKHLNTGETVVKDCQPMPEQFNNPRSSKMVVWSHTDDCIMDIDKSTIISIEEDKGGKTKKQSK